MATRMNLKKTAKGPAVAVFFLIALAHVHLPQAAAAVGNITAVQQNGNTLTLSAGSDVVIVEVCRTNVLRVDYRPNGSHANPTQIIGVTNWPSVASTIDTSGDPIVIQTAAMRVEIARSPCRLSLFDANGVTPLVKEQSSEGVFSDGLRLAPGKSSDFYGIYGFYVWDDTSAGMLRNSGGNVEAGFQGDSGAPLAYTRGGYGVLVDSDGGQFTVGASNLTFQFCSQPNILYYLVVGDPMDVMQGFMEVSGKPPMLPKWAMGFANTEWGINQQELTNIVATYRQKQIPIDLYILDFDWKAWGENNYGEWRWNTSKFPDGPSGVLKQNLQAKGIKLGGIMKPRVHVNTTQGGYATTNGFWWPGQSTYSDYFSGQPVKDVNFALAACRQWYFDHITNSFNTGIVGWWNDEADQAGGGGALFGNWQFLNMQRALYEGQRAMSSNRVWSINRNFYLGSQRYAYAMWSGDIDGGFNSMANERARMLASINVGGVKWGMDIGGFNAGDQTTSECYARWMQFGALVPIYRVHGQQNNQRQPWVYGATAEAAAKAAIQLRYSLIPYIYSYERQSLETGVGIVRPYFYHWPHDAQSANYIDGWMFGDWLLAAPVVAQGATSKSIYLPPGTWFDYFRGGKYNGAQTITYSLNSTTWTDIPLFVRSGAIIPTQPAMNYVGERPLTNVTVDVFPDWDETSFTYYDDDGDTYAYESGAWFKQRMSARLDEGYSAVVIEAPQGGYSPELETYTCRMHGPSTTAVIVNGLALPGYANSNALDAAGGEGWFSSTDRFGHVASIRVVAGEAKFIVASNDLVSAPVIEPHGGAFPDPVLVTISSRTVGASVRYTLDGSEPTELSTLYTEPFTIWISSTLKAKAFMAGRSPSDTSSAQFTVDNNLLKNAGFELPGTTTTNRALYWYPGEPDAHGDMWGSARRVGWRSHEGSWQGTIRGLWANAGSDGGFYQEAEAVPGQTYRFSAWFWADSSWSATRQGMKIEFLTGQPSGANYLLAVTNVITGIGQTWVQKTMEVAAPAGAEWVRAVVFVQGVGANGALQFDELNLESLGGYSLLVQSPHGSPIPAVGNHFFSSGQILTNSVDASVLVGNTQYVCSGWTLDGNNPIAGTNHVVNMVLTNNAVLTWLWVTNVLESSVLSFSPATYACSETAGVVRLEVVRTGGTAGTVQVQYRTMDVSAHSNSDYEAASGVMSFGDGVTNLSISIAISDDQVFEGDEALEVVLFSPTASASLGPLSNALVTIVDDDPDLGSNVLSVVSAYPATTPSVGAHYYAYGAMLACSASNTVTFGATQYVAAGWIGSGSVPASGATASTPEFSLTSDSEITWLWATNFWFIRSVEGSGSIAGPAAGWLPQGTNITLQAVAGTNYAFAGWTGDIDGSHTNDNPVSFALDAAKSVAARFVALPKANLLNNPSFEAVGSTVDRAAYWYPNEPDAHGETWGTALRVNWQPQDGSWHGAIRGLWSGAGSQGGVWQEVPAVPGTRYRFSAWFWADDGNPWGPWYAASQMMKIEFFSGGNMLMAVTNPLGVVNQVWQPRSMEAIAPTNAEWVRVVIAAYDVGSDGALQMDNLKLEILSVLPTPVVLPASETNLTSFTAAWSSVAGASGYSLHVATNADFQEPVLAADLFISEYGEGTGNNRVLEIFNGTGSAADLSNYRIWGINNGGSWPESSLNLSNTLADGATYVVRNLDALSTNIILTANQVAPNAAPMNFTGDDAVGLAKAVGGSAVLIDAIGTSGADPGTGWGVSGVADATQNHTLIRKPGVLRGNTDWITCSNEWDVLGVDVFTNLGNHTVTGLTGGDYVSGYHGRPANGVTSLTVTGLQSGVAYYFRVYATNDTGESAYSGIMVVTTRIETVTAEITAQAGVGGTIDPAGPVLVAVGSTTGFVISANAFYHIASIATNGQPVGITDPVTMTVVWPDVEADGNITATFAEDLATNLIPVWWLHSHYGVTNYDEAAMDDSDGDGAAAWEEFRADTDPTNRESVFRLTLPDSENGQQIRFASSTARIYRLEYSIEADDGWSPVDDMTNVVGESGSTVLVDTNIHEIIRYRISVTAP